MTYEYETSLPGAEVLARATAFFTSRVPATGAFLERSSARHVVLRGQGGEEIVIAVRGGPDGGTIVRGSTLMFGQQVKRFFTTLPVGDARGAA